jgi:hypothetical protein
LARRAVFGWYVRFPFFDLAISSSTRYDARIPSTGAGRNLNTKLRIPKSPKSDLGLGPRELPVLQSRVPGSARNRRWKRNLRFLPQDFHNCGKRCGKAGRTLELDLRSPYLSGFLRRRNLANRHLTGLRERRRCTVRGSDHGGGGRKCRFPEFLT